MQKYVLVTFLRPLSDGAEFTVGHWPLHTTLVSNFAIDLEKSDLVRKLEQFFIHQTPLLTTATGDAYFGPEKQIHVTLLDRTPELATLHNATYGLIRDCGAIFDEPQYLGQGFRPHATVQHDVRVRRGDRIAIATVSLVDMFPRGDIRGRKVMQTFKLGE